MKRITGLLLGIALLGMALRGMATESGGGAYPNGAEGLMTGALPPPGQYLVNYLMFYDAASLKNNDGHSIPIDFKVRALADVVRFINVTPIEVLGANWAQQVFLPVTYIEASVSPVHEQAFGIGDVIVDPFIFGWHKPPFHWVIGMDIYLPVGKYDHNDLANLGRNYWTFEPVLAVTYLNACGQELSAKLMYDFNTFNRDTNYRSGQEFHTDFVAAQHCGPWAVGVGGYWYQQTTDDRVNGHRLNADRGRQLALGPQLSYQYKAMNFSLAYDREFATENRPQGDKVWFKFVTPL